MDSVRASTKVMEHSSKLVDVDAVCAWIMVTVAEEFFELVDVVFDSSFVFCLFDQKLSSVAVCLDGQVLSCCCLFIDLSMILE